MLITHSVFMILTQDNSLCVYKYNNNEVAVKPTEFFENDSKSKTLALDESIYETELQDQYLQKNFIEQNKLKISEDNKGLITGLKNISDKLSGLLEENSRNPDIRKLNRDEFLINVQFNEELEQKTTKDIADIRFNSKIHNLTCEAERFLILKYTKENMKNDQKGINGIKQDVIIYNYVIPIPTQELVLGMRKAKFKAMHDLRAKVWRRTHG